MSFHPIERPLELAKFGLENATIANNAVAAATRAEEVVRGK